MGLGVKKPKYVHGFVDRHGKARYYLRRPGFKQVPLPGLLWSPTMMAVYEAAMSGEPLKVEIGASRTRPGTVAALVASYLGSAQFKSLAGTTRTTYAGILDRFRVHHGEKRVAMLERRHVEKIIGDMADRPAAATNMLKVMRKVMQFAVVEGMRPDDPTIGVKPARMRTDGFHTWTEAEIAQFEAKHAIGSRARLAFGLLLYTAQRRSDVIRMGRQHIRNGVVTITQQKTGTVVDVPVHSELQAIIDATTTNNLTFLTTEFGKPFSPAGFGNLFRDWCREAGLPEHCSAHGLRKAACRRLAEAGCSAHMIMAISGHLTLKEVTRYTAAVDRKRLAIMAMARTATGTRNGKPE